jgi:hypothetical protein
MTTTAIATPIRIFVRRAMASSWVDIRGRNRVKDAVYPPAGNKPGDPYHRVPAL